MRNDLSKERFRNEWKYLISTSEKELLELRMKHLLKKDPNAKGNGYMIRSLYFEDYFNSAYAEKESGVLMRKTYRIRIYDCSDRSIKLERKKKFGSYIYKESAPLTKEEFYKILDDVFIISPVDIQESPFNVGVDCNFLGNVLRYLIDESIILQCTTRYVQRKSFSSCFSLL